MNILAAFDKFKDSMTAVTACQAAADGISTVLGDKAVVTQAPLTDGGEGFCSILTNAAGGHIEHHSVSGPLGEEIDAPLGWVQASDLPLAVSEYINIEHGRLAIIEMAAVAGLELVPSERRHPRNCTTHGVGELIRIATAKDAHAILLGIGGSATSDLGLGALEALGLEYLATNGSTLEQLTPEQWPFLETIQGNIEIATPPIYIACDVDNPLLGERGAAAVYGPQKGLLSNEIEAFDAQAGRLAQILCAHCQQPTTLTETPGSGAAGGIGFGLKVACDAKFVAGFELVTAWLDLDSKIAKADLILTGEGKFDQSSLAGKGPYALIVQANNTGTPSIVFAGAVDRETVQTVREQFSNCAVYTITPEDCPLAQALAEAPRNLDIKVAEAIHHSTTHDG
jgi:glycerate kinase